MGMQDGYLDRMAARIAEFERELRGSSAEQLDDRRRRDLEAGLATVKERLSGPAPGESRSDRRDASELHPSFERLRAAFGEARVEAA